MPDPNRDGIDHINVYSQGLTWLGRFLSNFYEWPIQTDDGSFKTVEGYWYYLSTWDDRLRTTNGWDSKKLGRELRGNDWIEDGSFKNKIRKAITIKVITNPQAVEFLKKTDLPFTHYYVFKGIIYAVPKAQWILDFLEFLRKDIKENF